MASGLRHELQGVRVAFDASLSLAVVHTQALPEDEHQRKPINQGRLAASLPQAWANHVLHHLQVAPHRRIAVQDAEKISVYVRDFLPHMPALTVMQLPKQHAVEVKKALLLLEKSKDLEIHRGAKREEWMDWLVSVKKAD